MKHTEQIINDGEFYLKYRILEDDNIFFGENRIKISLELGRRESPLMRYVDFYSVGIFVELKNKPCLCKPGTGLKLPKSNPVYTKLVDELLQIFVDEKELLYKFQ